MEQIRRLLDRLEAKTALRTAIGAGLTWVIDQQLTEAVGWTDRSIGGLWAVISAIIILQSSLGGGYLEGSKRFLGVLIGSVFGALSTTWLGTAPLHLAISLFLTVILMGAFGLTQSMRIGSLSCAVVIIVWNSNQISSPWIFALHRFLDSVLGMVIGLLTSHFIFPSETVRKLEKNRKEIFQHFSTLLNSEEKKNDTVENIRELLKEDDLLLHDLQAEWTKDAEIKEHWMLMHSGEKRILELLNPSLHLSKNELSLLLDDHLSAVTEQSLAALNASFLALGSGEKNGQNLSRLLTRLEGEMSRFRETRATRTFSLQVLETYFVFFYHVEQLLLETDKMRQC